MKSFGAVSTVVAAATVFASSVYAQLDPIVIKGSKFFYKTNGTEFFIKGVAYQQDFSGNGSTEGNNQYIDPLADSAACSRDVPLMQALGLNTIRTYAIDPTQDHSSCMQTLASAGIYVISDLSAPGESINRATPTWNDDLYTRYTAVIDDLQQYTNVLGFFAGNEVSNNASNTDASAFVKAAVRDMKAYIKQKNYRTIGVGYATNDDADIRVNLADYFDCGSPADSIDFWGYNIYSWCGNSTYEESGYQARTQEFSSYNVPAFFAEYGCNTVQPRTFSEVLALYGDQMTPVWSGGIVYEWFQEANDYGLVSIDGSTASKLPDYTALSIQLAAISPSGVNSASYNPTNTAAQACPTVDASWGAASALPPTPNAELCSCMVKALNCVPSSEINDNNIGDLFGLVCGLSKSACDGIAANATTGDYGAYGMCDPLQQMGWALNSYYEEQLAAGNGASACDFSGSATTQAAASPTGQCASLISQAGNGGTGTVTSAPTATGGSGGGSSGGSSSGSGSSSTGSSAGIPGQSTLASLNFGYLQMGLYMVCAVVTGMGMIIL